MQPGSRIRKPRRRSRTARPEPADPAGGLSRPSVGTMRGTSLLVIALAVAAFAGACDASGDDAPARRALAPGALEPYEGLGTWVDVYDYVPEFQDQGEVPAVTPASVEDMA